MNKIYEVSATAMPLLAQWDLTNFLTNARNAIQNWGGLLLMLLGAVGLIWGGVLLIKKLMASPQQAGQQSGWGTIALLMLVGGALLTGGFQLVQTIGSGGQQTIEDLGTGTILTMLNLLG